MHLKRHIPGGKAGAIRVHSGQEVFPEDILAEGLVFGGFRMVHLAHELDVSPNSAASYLARSIGQKIYQGEVLAVRKILGGLSKKVIVSPVDGILDYYDETKGELRIKLLPHVVKLVSGVFGVVDKVEVDSGVILIKSLVDLVYGVFGSGKERDGILRVIDAPETLVSSKQISVPMSSEILVGGGLVFLDALEKAISMQVAGIITGGINAKDFRAMSGGKWSFHNKSWSDVGLSLVVTEGFGSIPMGNDIFSCLSRYDGRFVIIDGNRSRLILPNSQQNSIIYTRKVALPNEYYADSQPDLEISTMVSGSKVRLITEPYVGVQGVVSEIDRTATQLPSGVTTFLVTVDTPFRKIRVPYLNLEIIVN